MILSYVFDSRRKTCGTSPTNEQIDWPEPWRVNFKRNLNQRVNSFYSRKNLYNLNFLVFSWAFLLNGEFPISLFWGHPGCEVPHMLRVPYIFLPFPFRQERVSLQFVNRLFLALREVICERHSRQHFSADFFQPISESIGKWIQPVEQVSEAIQKHVEPVEPCVEPIQKHVEPVEPLHYEGINFLRFSWNCRF